MNHVNESILHILIQFLSMAIPFFTLIFITRTLPPDQIGLYEIFLVVCAILFPAVSAGFDQYIVNNFFRYSHNEKKNLIGNYLGYLGVISFIITCAAIPALYTKYELMRLPAYSYMFFGLLSGLTAIITVGQSISLMQNNILMQSLFLLGRSAAIYLLAIPLLIIFPNWNALLFSNILLTICVSTIAVRFLVKSNYFTFTINNTSLISQWSLGGDLCFLSIIIQCLSYSDRLFIQYFINSDSVGIYAIPSRITFACVMLVVASCRATMPRVVREMTCEGGSLVNVVSILYIYWFLIFIGFGGLALLGGNFLTLITGKSFHAGAVLIPPMAISSLLYALFICNSIVINSINKQKFMVYVAFFSLLINFILNYIFIPIYGNFGAAVISIITFGILSISTFLLLFGSCNLPWRDGFSKLATNISRYSKYLHQ